MVGGQVNPVISVIMDNNNSDYWTYLDKKEIIWFLRVILMMAHCCNELLILFLNMVPTRVTEVAL